MGLMTSIAEVTADKIIATTKRFLFSPIYFQSHFIRNIFSLLSGLWNPLVHFREASRKRSSFLPLQSPKRQALFFFGQYTPADLKPQTLLIGLRFHFFQFPFIFADLLCFKEIQAV